MAENLKNGCIGPCGVICEPFLRESGLVALPSRPTTSRKNVLKGTATKFQLKVPLEPLFPEEFLRVSNLSNFEGGVVSRRNPQ